MNIIKLSALFLFLVFLSFCGGKPDQEDENPPREDSTVTNSKGEQDDSGGRTRSSEFGRLKRTSLVVRSELSSRFEGGLNYDTYDGEDCDESVSCKDICSNSQYVKRNSCYNAPRALIENLDDGFYTLLNISEVDSVNVSPGILAGMLDLSTKAVEDLVEDDMSEGDLKSFLAWVAINEDIAKVFLKKDKRSKILEKAFEKIGQFQDDSSKQDELTGLNLGLIQTEDTFFSLASLENNEAGFEIAYKILKNNCRTEECKKQVLCAREDRTSNRRRERFGGSSEQCRTSASQSRRSGRRGGICYVQGVSVWSYLSQLIEDKTIKDRDFTGETKELTVDRCNTFCGGSSSSSTCKLIL